ncbi:MAG: pilus assembly protein PilM, partial [Planctomycetota bacterium]
QKIPIPVEDLATVRWMAELNEESVHGRAAVVTAARRQVIEDRISQWDALGLEVDGLQADTLALVNFLAFEFADALPDVMDDESVHREDAPAIALIDAGASATNLIVVSGESHWVWTMESGGEDITSLVARATKKTLSDAEKLKRNPADLKHPARQYKLVEQRQEEVRSRLETAFADGLQQDGRFAIEQSYCCGGASMGHGWVRRLMLTGK